MAIKALLEGKRGTVILPLAKAEPVDVFPLLRPFAIGFCIMFFPTVVIGTLNAVLSPVVQGTHNILETQTFDMNEYREQKDRLEREAMMRNPENRCKARAMEIAPIAEPPPDLGEAKQHISSATRSLTSGWTNSVGRPMTW